MINWSEPDVTEMTISLPRDIDDLAKVYGLSSKSLVYYLIGKCLKENEEVIKTLQEKRKEFYAYCEREWLRDNLPAEKTAERKFNDD